MKEALFRIGTMLLFVVAVSLSFNAGEKYGRGKGMDPAGKLDTVTVTKWVHDTVEVESSKPAGSVSAMLPLIPSKNDEISTPAEVYPDTIHQNKPDSALVSVPIEEKLCVGENYRAIIRGFQPELVDIWINQTENDISVPYRKRWSFTVGPQVGVGITPEGWRPYAGLGVTFGYSF